MSRKWIVRDVSMRHRLMVSMPIAVAEIGQGVVSLLTLGYVQPMWAFDVGVRQALRQSRRDRCERVPS